MSERELRGRVDRDGIVYEISERLPTYVDEVVVFRGPNTPFEGPLALGADGRTLVPHAAKLAAAALAEKQDRAEQAAIRKVALPALRDEQVAAGKPVEWIDARLAKVAAEASAAAVEITKATPP